MKLFKSRNMERVIEDLVWHLEFTHWTIVPNFYVSKLASKFVKVVLGGSGGDEFLVVSVEVLIDY